MTTFARSSSGALQGVFYVALSAAAFGGMAIFGRYAYAGGVDVLGLLIVIRDDDRRRHAIDVTHAQCGLLNERVLASEAQKLLGITAARERPKACTTSAAKNYRMDGHYRLDRGVWPMK